MLAERIEHFLGAKLPNILAVGVSGGSDSLFLTWVLKDFCLRREIMLVPLIVDHRLREESTYEAHKVADQLSGWGLAAHILTWKTPRKTSAAAREARYALLATACHIHGASHLFLAHHQDDLLETVLMREEKGSGWRGCAGFPALSSYLGVSLVRPLLHLTKNVFQDALLTEGITWFEDPSNRNPRYTRTRIRAHVTEMTPEERAKRLSEIAMHGHRRNAEAQKLRVLSENNVRWDPLGFLTIRISPFLEHEETFLAQALWHWIQDISSPREPLRQNALLALSGVIKKEFRTIPQKSYLGCLGGCLFMKSAHDTLCVLREWKRVIPSVDCVIKVSSRHNFIWDRRIICTTEVSPPNILHPVGRRTRSCDPESMARQSLPALDDGILVPMNEGYLTRCTQIKFLPRQNNFPLFS